MNYGPYTGVCPVCGKWFLTMWQEHWIHRRGDTFYCCEDCYLIDLKRDLKAMQEARQRRKDEKKVGARKITLEMKKKAVEIAISGGNPLDYLKSVGCKKPDGYWYTIKADLKKADPETYAKIPDYRGKTRKKEGTDTTQVDLVYDPEIAEEYRREQEQKKANEQARTEAEIQLKEAEPEIWRTTAIRNERLGEFYYDMKYKTIDWRHPAGRLISLPPEDFAQLADMIPQIMHVLGVDS